MVGRLTMGGYVVATASTPGFAMFRHASGTFVACSCLRVWLPAFERLQLARGRIRYNLDIVQLTGDAELSAGTHAQGGTGDVRQVGAGFTLDGRRAGAAWFSRLWKGNVHSHFVLNGCPHNTPARYQIAEYLRGEDGLAGDARDTEPRPATLPTWQEGMKWLESEIERLEEMAAPTPQQIAAAVWAHPLGLNPADRKTPVTAGYSLEIARNYGFMAWQLEHSDADVDPAQLSTDLTAELAAALRATLEDVLEPQLRAIVADVVAELPAPERADASAVARLVVDDLAGRLYAGAELEGDGSGTALPPAADVEREAPGVDS